MKIHLIEIENEYENNDEGVERYDEVDKAIINNE